MLAREESAFGATFTPDATQVVFDIGAYIVSVPAAGGEVTVLLRDQFWNADPTFSRAVPPWSSPVSQFTSDGSRIVYSRATTRTGELVADIVDYDRSELATMNVDGTDQIRLTPQSITSQDPSVGGGNR